MLKRWSINIGLMLLGTLIGVLILEAGLRVLRISYPSFNTWDEHRGTTLRPGAEGWWRAEGEAYIRVNSAGLRDREHIKEKPPHTFRIAVLGDSYAAAFQVPMDSTFWSVLEREMRKCRVQDDSEVEVINFGVSGYGTAQEFLTLQHIVWDYSPDLVILAFFPGNDISNNLRDLDKDPMKPYFVYQDGQLILDNSFRDTPTYRARQTFFARLAYGLINYSRVLQLLNQVKNIIRERVKLSRQQDIGTQINAGVELGLDEMIYFEPKEAVWKDAWQVTEEIITAMWKEIQRRGKTFLVVTLSTGIQVNPNSTIRQAFMKHLGVDTLFYPDMRIKALGEREGFLVLNLAPLLQRYAEQHGTYLHGFGDNINGTGHWNTNGHQIAGEIIARELVLGIHNQTRFVESSCETLRQHWYQPTSASK